MTEQSEGSVRRRLALTLIFLLSTHKGQYTLCLKMTHPLPAITWTNIVQFYPRNVVSAVYATATWLGGWLGVSVAGCLSVTRRYCIKTAKPLLKLFRPSGSPIIYIVSSDPCADTQFQGQGR